MTDTAPTFDDAIARTAAQQRLQMWQAAQTVSSHVRGEHDRAEILDCLGLTDVVRPDAV